MGAILCLMAPAAAGAFAQEEAYFWPLALPRDLSSSFGEYRPGRFHMGIDLRTAGVTGQTLYAAADGHIARVLCSPWGYGRAIYLQTDDGHTVVYGHLEGYYDELAAYVREAQHDRRSYTVELTPPPDRFPVKRGQIIGRTGDTGSGPAHLHYEIRDSRERPLNPRPLGITWDDSVAPMIDRLRVYPGDAGSFLNGAPEPVIVAVARKENGEYIADPVTATGTIGFGVAVVDRTPGGNVMGVQDLTLTQADTPLFNISLNRLSYDNHRDEVVCYDPYHNEKDHYQLLWRWPGNRTEGYHLTQEAGWWKVPAEAAVITVDAVDFMGNKTRLTIPITPAAPPAPAESVEDTAVAKKADGKLSLDYGPDYLLVTASFPTPEIHAPQCFMGAAALPFYRTDANRFSARWYPEKSGSFTMIVKHPRLTAWEKRVEVFRQGEGRTITAEGLQIQVPAETPYGRLFLIPRLESDAPASPLTPLSPAWRIDPFDAPLAKDITIFLPLPEGADRQAAIYRANGGGWTWLKTTRQGNSLSAATSTTGIFRVFKDDRSPRIQQFIPENQTPIENRRPMIRAMVEDTGSGIADWEVTCDGQWLLTAYDPEANQITWMRDEDLPPGQHEVRLTVTDRAGNQVEQRRTILVPAEK